jgi:hypothetical protein
MMGHKEERAARQLAHERAKKTISRMGTIANVTAAGGLVFWLYTDDPRGLLVTLGSLTAFVLWGMWKGYI